MSTSPNPNSGIDEAIEAVVSRAVARAIAAKIDVEILLNAEQASAFLQINPSGSRWQISGRTRPPKIKKVDVRVKLRRINAHLARPYPPDGLNKAWWGRLAKALGTRSSAFINASLYQLQAAAKLPCDGISEMAVNAALAMIEAAAPRDEVEGALAVQMACTHTAAMAILALVGGGHGGERRVAALASAAARLLRAYVMQVEVLRRLRRGGEQFVRVEHVHVHDGGQAIVGAVTQP